MDMNICRTIRSTVTVRVNQGKLIGSIKEGVFGATYQAFLGVPYASPPIGRLRFMDPEPPANWEGCRIATDYCCNRSAQLSPDSDKNIIGSEDCLYLNVYVPHEQYQGDLCKAVMVWIHGGNFFSGSGEFSETRPDYFMKKDVILVTINYRLGILGFLNLGCEGANGNQGLKDQIAALKWVRENIFNFGGDPSNVTIFGNGAGAISAHLLMLSPLSKGLFHKAILQSGVALCNWAIKEEQSEIFELLASMGCSSKDPKIILHFLRRIPFRVLIMAESHMLPKEERIMKRVIFGPTIDKESPNPFLPCPVSKLLDNGKDIPILIGHNSAEMLEFCIQMKDDDSFQKRRLETFVETFAGSHNSHNVPNYTQQILEYYGQKKSSLHMWPFNNMKRCLSDLYYNLPIRSVILNRVKQKAKTYYYTFSYDESNEIDLKKRPIKQSGNFTYRKRHDDDNCN